MHRPKFVCFVPLSEEMDYIDIEMRRHGAVYTNGEFDDQRDEHYYFVDLKKFGESIDIKFVVLSEMGNTGTAAAVYGHLAHERPDAAFLVGIAGTLDVEQFALGDVVMSSSVKFIGPDKVKQRDDDVERFAAHGTADGEDDKHRLDDRKRLGSDNWLRFRRDFIEFSRSSDLLSRYLRDRKPTDSPHLQPVPRTSETDSSTEEPRQAMLHRGSILGSEWVVDSAEFVSFLKDRDADRKLGWYPEYGTDAEKKRDRWIASTIACVDMESYGFFRSVASFRTNESGQMHAFSIRGISDPCQGKGPLERASGGGVRNVAARNALATFVDFAFYFSLSNVALPR